MAKHEEKYCTSCNQLFECKVGSISLCQCNQIELNVGAKQYIQQRFDDCICINCLKKINEKYQINSNE
jgi:Cysteine-rich CWC